MVTENRHQTPIQPLCEALNLSRASLYRQWAPRTPTERTSPHRPPQALSETEQKAVLALLHSERFVDLPPAQVYATLLDQGQYLCSVRTMYRLLAAQGEVRERRAVAAHRPYAKPELLATGPNQVWSWDITKLKGPQTWTYFYLYVILDIYSRYVTGWMIAERESAALAERLIEETCRKQAIAPDQLTLHADRGSSMTSKQVAHLLVDLGITKTHSRPRVSNDNPFSESQFKTIKYRPEFPDRFGSVQDARSTGGILFDWYNNTHRHSGIGYYRPVDVHYGRAGYLQQQRQAALNIAYAKHPERFSAKAPRAAGPPKAAWINPPKERTTTDEKGSEELELNLERELSHLN